MGHISAAVTSPVSSWGQSGWNATAACTTYMQNFVGAFDVHGVARSGDTGQFDPNGNVVNGGYDLRAVSLGGTTFYLKTTHMNNGENWWQVEFGRTTDGAGNITGVDKLTGIVDHFNVITRILSSKGDNWLNFWGDTSATECAGGFSIGVVDDVMLLHYWSGYMAGSVRKRSITPATAITTDKWTLIPGKLATCPDPTIFPMYRVLTATPAGFRMLPWICLTHPNGSPNGLQIEADPYNESSDSTWRFVQCTYYNRTDGFALRW